MIGDEIEDRMTAVDLHHRRIFEQIRDEVCASPFDSDTEDFEMILADFP